MTKIYMRRKPRWKRIVQSPFTWYRHYLVLRRGRENGRVKSMIVAAKLAYLVVKV